MLSESPCINRFTYLFLDNFFLRHSKMLFVIHCYSDLAFQYNKLNIGAIIWTLIYFVCDACASIPSTPAKSDLIGLIRHRYGCVFIALAETNGV